VICAASLASPSLCWADRVWAIVAMRATRRTCSNAEMLDAKVFFGGFGQIKAE